MTTPSPLLRAKLAVGVAAVAAMTAASTLNSALSVATANTENPARQIAVQLVAEISDSTTPFGVADSHLYDLGPDRLALRLTELRNLGVTDLRIAVPWVYIEPAKGSYNWAKMDAVVETATAMGFTLTGAVTATPTWAGLPLAGAPDPDTYAAFAGSVAERYGSQIAAYEVWNEPNGVIFYAPVDPAGYTRMLQAAYTAIKTANPDAVVLAGALGATGDLNGISVTPQRFLAEMYAAGAAGYFDALSYHPYNFTLPFSGGGSIYNAPLDQVRKLYELMVANGDGDKQIWATEYGTPTTPGWGVTQKEQAALLRDFLTAWSKLPYAGPAFVYTSEDAKTGILNHEFNFGLFTSDGRPKPAAQVLAELIAASGLGDLPDYTAPRMSAARDLYLQLASIGFGLVNQALILPNAAIAVVYNLMPGPLRKAFTAVANAVSAVVAQVAIAVTPVMEAALGLVVRALPKPPAPAVDTADDETDETTTGLAEDAADRDGTGETAADPGGETDAVLADDADIQPASAPEDDGGHALEGTANPDTVEELPVDPVDVEESLTTPGEETEPIADPTEPSEPDTTTDSDDAVGETETVSTDEPADESDTGTEVEPGAKDSSVIDTGTRAGKRTREARSEDSAVQSDRAPRRGPRTATSTSQERASSPGADRADDRSASRGSGRDATRSGVGE
uniref:cellulase family glycosylhydrolase n=1 Tax=Mycolicibacterium bacteremicum TaxID=564198 RepID=UPI0026EB7FEA